MTSSFDTIIIGLGAMGSAAARYLAKRNRKVLGLDRFTPPHSFGSSHGQTRIIREAYYEGPQYVPIIQKAYQNWEELELECGQQLYLQTGGMMVGSPASKLVKGALWSAQLHHLTYEILDAGEIQKRFPAFHPSSEMIAVWEPRAGIMFPEKCIEANLQSAAKKGAVFHFNEPATSWKGDRNGISVITSKGIYHADHLLLTAGAWLKELVSDLNLPLTNERQVLYWFEPKMDRHLFDPKKFPIYIWSYDNERIFYGFPNLGQGIKIARHYEGEMTTPDTLNRKVDPKEVEFMRGLLKKYLPAANGELRETAVCMYTNTPDCHFLIKLHPNYPQVLIASICSGHGFKFASAFGEILSDILLEKRSPFDLSLFGFHH